MFDQEGALEFEQPAAFPHAKPGHDEIEPPFVGRWLAGLASAAKGLFGFADLIDQFRDLGFRLGRIDTVGQALGFVRVEGDIDGDFALRQVDPDLADQRRRLNSRHVGVDLWPGSKRKHAVWFKLTNIMLNKIKVESFKSLEKVEIDLGLVNVFIGANGSGKSNLLEAIGVLGAAANGRVDDEALLRRGVRPGLPVLYKASFKSNRQPAAIHFTASNEESSYSVGLFNPLDKPEPAWRFKTELLMEGEIKHVGRSQRLKIHLDPTAGYAALKAVELPEGSVAGKLLKELRQFAIFAPDTATLRGLDTDTQSREPVGLSGGRLAEAVKDVFGRLHPFRNHTPEPYESVLELIDWADVVVSTSPDSVPVSKNIPQPTRILRFRDRFMAEGRNILSGYDASEGALYMLFMTVLVHHRESPPVLAVDNFDHALNPRLAKALTRKVCDWMIARQNRQLLLTSHNPLVLDGLPLWDDTIRLFTVERSNRGKTVVHRVEVSEELLDKANKGVPLSQQWVMGTFGGVPTNI